MSGASHIFSASLPAVLTNIAIQAIDELESPNGKTYLNDLKVNIKEAFEILSKIFIKNIYQI